MDTNSKKILIVEDEASLRRVIVDMVKQRGFIVFEANNGEEGLLKAFGEHPDLILSDILMPKIDGLTMLKKLREDAWGKDVPVIMLTNVDPDDSQLEDIVENKASYYLSKTGISLNELIDKIQDLLRE